MNVQHWLLLLSATARIRSQLPRSPQLPLLPSRSRRRRPLQCPWMWRRQPILPHPLPSIQARAAVTLHDARGIPTRLVNPITPEDMRDSGSRLLRGLDERGIPAARGGQWSAPQVMWLLERAGIPFGGSAANFASAAA